MKKIQPTLKREQELWRQGFNVIGGVDEAGRGAWAGPVVASVIVLPKNHKKLADVCDSKLVSKKQRLILYHQILEAASDFGIGVVNNAEIDRIGIHSATKQAFAEAVAMLTLKPDYLLVDAFDFETNCRLEAVIKGDQKIYSISCASIIAKVMRDNIMENLDESYLRYEFCDHKGYGTKRHQELLQDFGPCNLHRFSYKPIRELL